MKSASPCSIGLSGEFGLYSCGKRQATNSRHPQKMLAGAGPPWLQLIATQDVIVHLAARGTPGTQNREISFMNRSRPPVRKRPALASHHSPLPAWTKRNPPLVADADVPAAWFLQTGGGRSCACLVAKHDARNYLEHFCRTRSPPLAGGGPGWVGQARAKTVFFFALGQFSV